MNVQQERQLSLLVSWAATLIFLWAATYVFRLGLSWFAVLPILLALHVNIYTRAAIKRVLVAVFGAPFVKAAKHTFFILLGFGSALDMASFIRSFPSLAETAYIVWALALATTGIIQLLAQFGFIEFSLNKNSASQ